PPGDEQARAKRDLDGILAGDAQDDLPPALTQPSPQLGCDVGLRQVAERVDAAGRLIDDRSDYLGVPVAERGDPEAAGQVDVLAAIRVDDSAALGLGPDQGFNRLSVSTAIYPAIFGFSCSRRSEYSYH